MDESIHGSCNTWLERNRFLLNNDVMSDCSFLVEEVTTDGPQITKIPAHKYILAASSPEFFNLFYLMKPDSDDIPINDVTSENLVAFLEFLYTEYTKITMDNIDSLLELSGRYSVVSLKNECGEFVVNNINVENVFIQMDKYLMYEFNNFEITCLVEISNFPGIFSNPAFVKISNNTLTTILKSKYLIGFKEFVIFKSVNNWAEVYCDDNNQQINSKNKRLALGPALKFVRFAAMTTEEFTLFTADNPVLLLQETLKIFQFFGSLGRFKCSYSAEKRKGENITIKLPDKDSSLVTKILAINNYKLFDFTFNKPLAVDGFTIYSRVKDFTTENPDKFIISIRDDKNRILVENTDQIMYLIKQEPSQVYVLRFEKKLWLLPFKNYSMHIHRQVPGQYLNYVTDQKISKQFVIKIRDLQIVFSDIKSFFLCKTIGFII